MAGKLRRKDTLQLIKPRGQELKIKTKNKEVTIKLPTWINRKGLDTLNEIGRTAKGDVKKQYTDTKEYKKELNEYLVDKQKIRITQNPFSGQYQRTKVGLTGKERREAKAEFFIKKWQEEPEKTKNYLLFSTSVAYTGASVAGNIISEPLMEAIDIGLASKDWKKFFRDPSKETAPMAFIEAIDVAVDFLPLSFIIPNFNAQTNYDTKARTEAEIRAKIEFETGINKELETIKKKVNDKTANKRELKRLNEIITKTEYKKVIFDKPNKKKEFWKTPSNRIYSLSAALGEITSNFEGTQPKLQSEIGTQQEIITPIKVESEKQTQAITTPTTEIQTDINADVLAYSQGTSEIEQQTKKETEDKTETDVDTDTDVETQTDVATNVATDAMQQVEEQAAIQANINLQTQKQTAINRKGSGKKPKQKKDNYEIIFKIKGKTYKSKPLKTRNEAIATAQKIVDYTKANKYENIKSTAKQNTIKGITKRRDYKFKNNIEKIKYRNDNENKKGGQGFNWQAYI